MTAPHEIMLLHFGVQCPWQPWVADQARQAAAETNRDLRLVDVSERPELATRYRLFYPFMTVVDQTLRLPSPMPASELVRIIDQGVEFRQPTPLNPPIEARAEVVVPLNFKNIGDACSLCIQEDPHGCQAKVAWAKKIACHIPGGFLGMAAFQVGEAVGVVEVLPATLVPYPLPVRSVEICFITCLYSLEDGPDYRGQVLECLVQTLPEHGARELQVVSGSRLPYPNGPVDFFIRYGFEPLGELDRIVVSEGEDTLVLLKREL